MWVNSDVMVCSSAPHKNVNDRCQGIKGLTIAQPLSTVFPTHCLICGGAQQNQDRPPHIAFRFYSKMQRIRSAAISFPCSPSVSLTLTRLTHTAPPLHAQSVCLYENVIIHWNNNVEAWYLVQTAGESHEFMKVLYPSPPPNTASATFFLEKYKCGSILDTNTNDACKRVYQWCVKLYRSCCWGRDPESFSGLDPVELRRMTQGSRAATDPNWDKRGQERVFIKYGLNHG